MSEANFYIIKFLRHNINYTKAAYNIDIEECPNIKKLNTSTDNSINNTFASMVYCNNLTLRKSNVVSLEGLYSRGEVDTPVRIRIA